MITGIVVALPEELSTLTAKKIEKGCIGYIGEKILVVYSGIGPKNASASAELLVKQGIGNLISWGCVASLDKAFKPGDLVVTDSFVDVDGVGLDIGNKDWVTHVQAALAKELLMTARAGKLAESKNIVVNSRDKEQLATTSGAIAVDMESVAIAKVAKSHGLPFLAVRAVADPLDMDLPKAVSHALNDQGEVILSKLLMFLLLHPSELPGLVKLGLHFYAAKNTLKRVAKLLDVLTKIPQAHTNSTR